MIGNPNISQYGKKFSSTNQPPPERKGRKPSKLKKYLKDNNVTANDLALLAKNVLFTYSEEQLKDLLVDKTKPMIIRLMVRAFLEDFKKGSMINTDRIIDRAFGAPDQNIMMMVSQMTPEERQAKIEELYKKLSVNTIKDVTE